MRGILIDPSKQEFIELNVNQNGSLVEKNLRNPATQKVINSTYQWKEMKFCRKHFL